MKKIKMSRRSAICLSLFVLLLSIGMCFLIGGVSFSGDIGKTWVWYHSFSMFSCVTMSIIIFCCIIYDLVEEGYSGGLLNILYEDHDEYYDKKSESSEGCNKSWNIKKMFLWGVFIISMIYLFTGLYNIYNDTVNLYNTSKKYQNKYTQKVDEKKGFYDKLWKTYLQKDKITNVYKETFIEVTKIIMENRRDGKDVTWKWIQENQNIPYEEFTKFYADLSNFITEQREGYFNIEKECQLIANQNNTLLDTFPNNLYNKILNCQRIKFEYGFTSDSTETVFKTKKENIQ